MELSLRFLANKLSFSYKVEVLNDDTNMKFATVRLFDSALSVSTKYDPIVIMPARFGPEHVPPTFKGVIWLGSDRPMFDQPTIWVREPVSEFLVLDRVLNIFDMHEQWCDSVRDVLLNQEPFANAVPLLSQVTINPYYYADAGFRTLAIKDDDTLYASSSSWRMQSEIGRHPVEILSKFITSGELDTVNKRRSAWLFDSTTFHVPFVSRTVFCRDEVFGHLFIIETYPDQEVFDVELLEMFGQLLERHLNLSTLSYSSTGRPFEPMLINYLAGASQSSTEVDYLLKLLSWRNEDKYRVVVFEQANETHHGFQSIALAEVQAIEDNLPNCRAFLHEGMVVCVINESMPESIASDVVVQHLCERFNWKAGISNLGSSFGSVRALHKRARTTLRMGRLQDEDTSVYLFEEYRLPIVLSALEKSTDSDHLMHDDLRTLIEYDRKNGSELVETLKVYLDCERNASRTADAMFLHRNSISYRLEKIHSLIESDLEDPANRLFLLLSISVWMNSGGKIGQ